MIEQDDFLHNYWFRSFNKQKLYSFEEFYRLLIISDLFDARFIYRYLKKKVNM